MLLASDAYALGLTIQPSRLSFELRDHDTAQQTFTVTNGSKDPARFEVYADDFESLFSIQPARFDLKPGEIKRVTVTLRPIPQSMLATTISVLAHSAAPANVSFQTGIKIPVSASQAGTFNLTASITDFAGSITSHWFLSTVALLASVLIVLWFYRAFWH